MLKDNNFSGRRMSSNVIQGGFRPLLYTVANGSYTSNSVYGVNAAQVNNYQIYQLPRGTSNVPLTGNAYVTSTEGCDYRKADTKIEFNCSVVLKSRVPDPGFRTEELRIGVYPRDFTDPPEYSKALPNHLRTTDLPLFNDVEILDKNGTQIAPDATTPAGVYRLQARLLWNGNLALVLQDLSSTPPTVRGLQHDDIADAFGVADNVIRINIRGKYSAQV